MKKLLVFAAATALSTSTFATKARILSLAEDTDDGTFVIQDDRHLWTNVAYLNKLADRVIVELGGNGSAATQSDALTSPKREAGFFKSAGNYTWGVHLGKESNTSQLLRLTADTQALGTATLNKTDNAANIFFGGKASAINWAVALGRHKYENKNSTNTVNQTDEGMGVRLGAMTDKWEGYANISLKGEAEDVPNNRKFDGKGGFQLGGSYTHGQHKAFLSHKQFKWDAKTSATVTKPGKFTRDFLGYGNIQEMGSSRVITTLKLDLIDVKLDYNGGTTTFERTQLPLIVSYESDVNSWLTLRAGVSQTLINKVKQKNLANVASPSAKTLLKAGYSDGATETDGEFDFSTTKATAGASFKLNNFTIDGALAYSAAGAQVGKLNSDDFMSRVGMTYKF